MSESVCQQGQIVSLTSTAGQSASSGTFLLGYILPGIHKPPFTLHGMLLIVFVMLKRQICNQDHSYDHSATPTFCSVAENLLPLIQSFFLVF